MRVDLTDSNCNTNVTTIMKDNVNNTYFILNLKDNNNNNNNIINNKNIHNEDHKDSNEKRKPEEENTLYWDQVFALNKKNSLTKNNSLAMNNYHENNIYSNSEFNLIDSIICNTGSTKAIAVSKLINDQSTTSDEEEKEYNYDEPNTIRSRSINNNMQYDKPDNTINLLMLKLLEENQSTSKVSNNNKHNNDKNDDMLFYNDFTDIKKYIINSSDSKCTTKSKEDIYEQINEPIYDEASFSTIRKNHFKSQFSNT
eukprot:Pgem_evm1s5580